MPAMRKLAYRDRFVWQLIQTMNGGSSSLPPLQFSPGTPTNVLVSWTQEQWNRIFASLLNGADLTYPESAHQVVWDLLQFVELPIENPVQTMQSSFLLDARHIKRGFNDAGSLPTIVNNVAAYANFYVWQTPFALNDTMHYKMFMASGDYYIRHTWHRNTNCGILSTSLLQHNGGAVVPVAALTGLDMRGALLWNQITEGTFTIDEPGEYKLIFSVSGTSLANQYAHLQSQTYIWLQNGII